LARFATTLLVDSGFWYALYDKTDQHHAAAREKSDLIESANILILWPVLYETFNSRFAKNKVTLRSFERLLRQAHVSLLPDDNYREAALDACFSLALNQSRTIALVDMVIRLIVEDRRVRKHGLLTFNPRDFNDVCLRHQVEIL
jgi:predicted nucleic acid-binding protein